MISFDSFTDGQLLWEFCRNGKEAVFAELIRRHGGMVHGVCMRILDDFHEAQDVTQAVFLTLARKAGSLRRDASVAGWLHHVATCLARDTRKANKRRTRRELAAVQEGAVAGSGGAGSDGLHKALDQAIVKLPERYRQPLIMFHLEGHSLAATAKALGMKPSAVSARLVRCRQMLHNKLARSGDLSGHTTSLTAALATAAETSAVSDVFVSATAKAASLSATGAASSGVAAASEHALALSRRAGRMLMWSKSKTAAATLTIVATATGVAIPATLSLFARDKDRDPRLYMVVDLSAGPDAGSYPVTYLDAEPAGGWTDGHRTEKLVLRHLPVDTPENNHDGDTPSIAKGSYLGIFEVTQRQWELVMGGRPSHFANDRFYATRPVENVTVGRIRPMAMEGSGPRQVHARKRPGGPTFMERLRMRTGLAGFDLPSWHVLARAHRDSGTQPQAVNRGTVPQPATADLGSGTAKVGSHAPNDWGLYDISGNVSEMFREVSWSSSRGTNWSCGSDDSSVHRPLTHRDSMTGFRVFSAPSDR